MTKFITASLDTGEVKEEKKTVFTHYLNAQAKVLEQSNDSASSFDCVLHLGQLVGGMDAFLCVHDYGRDSLRGIYIGTAGDEFKTGRGQ
jgi:hypothetical protein